MMANSPSQTMNSTIADVNPCVAPIACYNSLRLAMFSGKGGVGKTTLSCGFARYWAKQFPSDRVLLISTDPAHSLGDVLQIEVSNVSQPINDLPNLQARALDAQSLLRAFKAKYGEVLEILVERGSFVEGEDLSPIWDLSWPGLDELMGVLEIQRLLREHEADRVVVDMAPSGHTLNLFGLMDFLDGLLDAFDLFQEKHRVLSQQFAGQYIPDQADKFLAEIRTDLIEGRSLLQDKDRTACLAVAIPEPMSWVETRRFLEALRSLQIPTGGIFVNQVIGSLTSSDVEPILCSGFDLNQFAEQQRLLNQFSEIAAEHPVFLVPKQTSEPVGCALLDHLLRQLIQLDSSQLSEDHGLEQVVHYPEKVLPSFANFIDAKRRLILVGGKGGVGKTTVASAIAWAMANCHPGQRVRIISIDPAHSLGDALGRTLSHDPDQLTHNLSAQEIDAARVLDQFRDDYLWELAEMMSGDTGGDSMQIAYGPQAWRQIVAQALPGIDEMLALLTVMDLLEQGQQDLIVLDTAPTGHLLRFLEMPTALSDWLTWIFKLWIKYQTVAGRVDLMSRLRSLRQRVVQAQKKLQDVHHTEFIGVVQDQSAILAEAQRLTQSLLHLQIHQRYVVHNRYESKQSCIQTIFPGQTIVRLPILPRNVMPVQQIQIAASLLF
jgi:arsenite-transporting ATPase